MFQKLSTSKRQIGGDDYNHPVGLPREPSARGANLSRFGWFSMASLEHFSSSFALGGGAATDEGAPALDRDNSGESGESLGDIPIELRHLEGDFTDPLGEEDLAEFQTLQNELASNLWSLLGSLQSKSKSLDDLTALNEEAKKHKPKLMDVGRASTYDEGSTRQPGREEEQNDSCDTSQSGGKRFLKDIRNSLSASLKSVDVSIRSGSLTSISSGKSVVSNFSVQSDSGIGLAQRPSKTRADKSGEHLQIQKQLLGARNWGSEPHLDTKSASAAAGGRRSRTRTLTEQEPAKSLTRVSAHQCPLGEKEKSKAMLSVESKLMKAIKEVNESELSEYASPLESPGPQREDGGGRKSGRAKPATTEQQGGGGGGGKSEKPVRPQLVKQKKSFHFPEEEREERVSESSLGGERATSDNVISAGPAKVAAVVQGPPLSEQAGEETEKSTLR